MDPLTMSYPWYTPYQFAGNKVISCIDLDGLEEYHYIRVFDKDGTPTLILTSLVDIVESVTTYTFSRSLYNDAPIPHTETKTNARQEYIVHDVYTTLVDVNSTFGNKPIQEEKSYDLRWNYSSEENARIGKAGTRNFLDWTLIALDRANKITKEENKMNGVAGMVGNLATLFITKLYKTVATKLVAKYAASIISASKKTKDNPYSITVVYDKITKKYYTGQNGGISAGSDVNSILKKKMPKESNEKKWKVTNCSECDAYNKALNDKANWDNLEHSTLKFDSKTGTYIPQAPCKNCQVTFKEKLSQQ